MAVTNYEPKSTGKITTQPSNPKTHKTTTREREITMAQITEELRAKAEVYHGDEICQEKSKFLLSEVGLPRGLLPLKDIIECGYVEETGFVWLKQKKKIDHCFEKIGKQVSYGTEITATVEKLRIKKLTGVKVKELMMWLQLTEISVNDPPNGKLTCKISSGLFRTFPTVAFELEEDLKKEEEKKEKEKEMVTSSA